MYLHSCVLPLADARLKLGEATPVLLRKNKGISEAAGAGDRALYATSRGVQTPGRKTAQMVECHKKFDEIQRAMALQSRERYGNENGLRFETSNLNYPGIHMHVASENHFHGLRDSSGLQMTSEAMFEVRFELSGLNYVRSYDCLASNCHHSQNVPTPIPPSPPQTVPI